MHERDTIVSCPNTGSLDELADGQQNGRGRVDPHRRRGVGTARFEHFAGLCLGLGQGTTDAFRVPLRPTVNGTARIGRRTNRTIVSGSGGHRIAGGDRGACGRGVPLTAAALARQQRLECVPEVFQVVRVQQRVSGRVEMRQDDARVDQGRGHRALAAKRLHAVDRVQWHPADGEERHYYRQVLCGLHLTFPGRTQHAQFRRTIATTLATVQQCHLFDLKRIRVIY